MFQSLNRLWLRKGIKLHLYCHLFPYSHPAYRHSFAKLRPFSPRHFAANGSFSAESPSGFLLLRLSAPKPNSLSWLLNVLRSRQPFSRPLVGAAKGFCLRSLHRACANHCTEERVLFALESMRTGIYCKYEVNSSTIKIRFIVVN